MVEAVTRRFAVVVLSLLAACSSRWDRALVLDLALSDPAALGAVAEPWHAAGYRVDYRRFYPHLTYEDLRRYEVVILLGGREPDASSDAITAGDLTLLWQWLDRGGVVVWGYAGDREGYADRWSMNRWLEWVGAGIVVGDYALADSTERGALFEPQPRAFPLPESALRRGGFQPFPFGRNHVLVVSDPSQALARTSVRAFVRPTGEPPQARPRAPVAAARRVGDGLVVVMSRHALGSLGPELRASTLPALALDEADRTRTFLVALARWTQRPAEWALLPPLKQRGALRLEAQVSLRPARVRPPPGAGTVELPAPAAAQEPGRRSLPTWLTRDGLRALESPRALVHPDSIVMFLDVGGLNALVSSATAPPQPIADTASGPLPRGRGRRIEPRGPWRTLLERLETTSFHWIPGVDLRDLRPPTDTAAYDLRGGRADAWCALDSAVWEERILPTYLLLARLAAALPDLVPAIAFDLDAAEGKETGFCERTYRALLDTLARDTILTADRAAALAAVAPAERYDSLLEAGLLEPYFAMLERLVAVRAAQVRADVRRIRPDLLFAVRATRWPSDWFGLGVLRGLAGTGDDAPLLLWTREVRPRRAAAELRSRGIATVTALAVSPRRLQDGDWGGARLRRAAFRENDGFWLIIADDGAAGLRAGPGRVSADSLGRLVRRLSKDR